MDILFVRQGEYEKGDRALPLIEEAESVFFGADFPEVIRDVEGRPCFDAGSGADLSITHSGDIWMCLISDGRCGLDFQYCVDRDPGNIAARYYTPGEREYMEEGNVPCSAVPFLKGSGERTGRFFDIWTRREALGKYEGHGFFGSYPDSAPGGIPAASVLFPDRQSRVYFHQIPEGMLSGAGIRTKREFRAVCCTESEEPPVIKVI